MGVNQKYDAVRQASIVKEIGFIQNSKKVLKNEKLCAIIN